MVGIFRLTGDQGIRKFEEFEKTQNAMPKRKSTIESERTSLDKSIASSPLYDIYSEMSAALTIPLHLSDPQHWRWEVRYSRLAATGHSTSVTK